MAINLLLFYSLKWYLLNFYNFTILSSKDIRNGIFIELKVIERTKNETSFERTLFIYFFFSPKRKFFHHFTASHDHRTSWRLLKRWFFSQTFFFRKFQRNSCDHPERGDITIIYSRDLSYSGRLRWHVKW